MKLQSVIFEKRRGIRNSRSSWKDLQIVSNVGKKSLENWLIWEKNVHSLNSLFIYLLIYLLAHIDMVLL